MIRLLLALALALAAPAFADSSLPAATWSDSQLSVRPGDNGRGRSRWARSK